MTAPQLGDLMLVSEPAGDMFTHGPITWAVAVLTDGTEVRIRHCGNYIEIRGWDTTLTCKPPPIEVDRVGRHVVDVRRATPGGPS